MARDRWKHLAQPLAPGHGRRPRLRDRAGWRMVRVGREHAAL